MNQCVYCGSTTTLDTQLTISLDTGGKATVYVCAVHAEDASVKTARQAYVERQAKITEVLEAARALGLDISEGKSGLVVATASPQAQTKGQPSEKSGNVSNRNTTTLDNEENVVDTSLLDSKQFNLDTSKFIVGSGVPSAGGVSISQLEDKLDPALTEGKAVMAVAEGKAGIPVAFTKTRIDGTGTTHVNIIKSDNDEKLQKRFKKMASDSKERDIVPDFARSGYSRTTTNCPLCTTEGTIKQNGKIMNCPKCNGAGIISTH